MLGKLFNLTGAPAPGTGPDNVPSSQTVSSLESVQEDIHTRNLVFPDAQALHQNRNHEVFPLPTASTVANTSSTAVFDYDTNFELESRDIRILIMQDALSSMPASLLYDSQTPPPPPNSPDRPNTTAGMTHFHIEPRRTPMSPRRPSMGFAPKPVVVQPDSPQSRQGAFDRRQSIQSRAQPRIESESQRAYREYTDELAIFSSCIFGSAELLAYKGTSTKVHVVPSETSRHDSFSISGDGRGSLGRSSTRTSKLSQSFSSEHVSPLDQAASFPPVGRAPDGKKVLITRLFPVTLPTVEDVHSMTPQSRFSDDNSGYPFPSPGEEAKTKKKKPQPKQKRTPMYAIALVINLPQSGAGASSSKTPMRGAGSYTDQESFPSSYGSHQRSGWSMVSPTIGPDMRDFSSGLDTEERIDPITQHWDIIMRTLTNLQSVVATAVFNLLRYADINSPDPFPSSITSHLSRTSSVSGRRSEDGTSASKPHKTNAKQVALLPNCLMENLRIKMEVDASRRRIVTGLRATRVVTGQNRWGIWREEARWITKWTGPKDQDFFYNLLSGFLATHNEWLQGLSPGWYRRRHYQQEKTKPEEDTALASRTILVAGNKMIARRLLFLLSAFLPAPQQLATLRAHRPSTSASWGPLSQSPPSLVVPILKEESLRRKLNRRPGNRQSSHSRKPSLQGQSARPFVIPSNLAHLNMEKRHERRSSDTASIRTMNLPIVGGDINRKSSAATMSTVGPEATTAHFTRVQSSDLQSHGRRDSSSAVAEDLKRTLRRGDSTGQHSRGSNDSNQSSKWGSMISGFWTSRRRDSTSLSAHTRGTSGMGDEVPISPIKSVHRHHTDTLSRMVREAQLLDSPDKDNSNLRQPRRVARETFEPRTPRLLPEESHELPSQRTMSRESSRRVPNPAGAFESPVKTSINLEDGVIDVDVPFPEYITSFETAVSSPSSSGYLSTGLEAFEQSCRIDIEGDVPPNVAGWLQEYHPDFVLQAIPPQDDNLVEQIKASMRAEPSPAQPLNNAAKELQKDRWLDISTALIVDVTTFKILRLRYRRLVRSKVLAQDRTTPLLSVSAQSYGNAGPTTPAVSPYETHLEDEFIHEKITTFDDLLANAVHSVIALGGISTDVHASSSGTTSGLGSGGTSRSASVRRGRSNSASIDPDNDEPTNARQRASLLPLPLPPKEVPKGQCKAVVLSALEELVREAVKEREDGGKRETSGANVLRAAVHGWLENIENGAE